MKLSLAKNNLPDGTDAAALVAICRRLEEARAQRSELTRWLTRFERSESSARGELQRQARRRAAGDQNADPRFAQELFDRAAADARGHREKAASAGAEIKRLEERIVSDTSLVPSLQAEIARLEDEGKKLQGAWEQAALSHLLGAQKNGDLEEARSALQGIKREIAAVQQAIETAKSLQRAQRIREAIKASLPAIEAAAGKQWEALDLAQEAGKAIESELANLKKAHGFDLPGAWPVRDFKAVREKLSATIEKLKQEVSSE